MYQPAAYRCDVEYAVDTLTTPLIVVPGHPGCAAMHTALKAWHNVASPEGAARAVVEQTVSSLTRLDASIVEAEDLSAAHVVQTGVTLLHKSPMIAKDTRIRVTKFVNSSADVSWAPRTPSVGQRREE